MKVLVFVALLIAALGLTMWTYEEVNCRFGGYERFRWYAEGKEIGRPGKYGLVEFAPLNDRERFKDAKLQIDYFDRYIQCAAAEDAYRLSVVRFSVSSSFHFHPIEAAVEPKNVNWYEAPANAYVPWSVYKSGQNARRTLATTTEAWLPTKPGERSRADLIATFNAEWLKGESLDEDHLMGIWQGGWLFRSSKPGHYVWIN